MKHVCVRHVIEMFLYAAMETHLHDQVRSHVTAVLASALKGRRRDGNHIPEKRLNPLFQTNDIEVLM